MMGEAAMREWQAAMRRDAENLVRRRMGAAALGELRDGGFDLGHLRLVTSWLRMMASTSPLAIAAADGWRRA